MIQHFLSHWLGLDDASGSVYLWWSGIFGDATIVAIPIVLLRKHNCHAKGCPRIGRHAVEGTAFVVCRRHHPEEHQTVADIHEAWKREQG